MSVHRRDAMSAMLPPDDQAEDLSVTGPRVRVMWDTGAGPLWDEAGLLSDDPGWMRRALGLSEGLIADLLGWLSDMSAAGGVRSAELDERGGLLAERLQEQIGARYEVRFQA
jgi:hypothetical protein